MNFRGFKTFFRVLVGGLAFASLMNGGAAVAQRPCPAGQTTYTLPLRGVVACVPDGRIGDDNSNRNGLVKGTNGVAFGFESVTSGGFSTAVGTEAFASNQLTTAVGAAATATGDSSTAIGARSSTTGKNAVALGAGASASGNSAVAIGANSVANEANTVSVGSIGSERRITNVASGVNGTDAVNLNQLNTATAGFAGSLADIDSRLSQFDKRIAGGTAVATAMSGNAFLPDMKFNLTGNVATYDGAHAGAIQLGAMVSRRAAINAGVATGFNRGGKTAARVGFTVGW